MPIDTDQTQTLNIKTTTNPLGQEVSYHDQYQPSLLFPIARKIKRDELGLKSSLPFHGQDIWNAYELSWLNKLGLPQVAIAEFRFPADSPNIVESKSLKLYLNSLNQTIVEDWQTLRALIEKDLSKVAEANVEVILTELTEKDKYQIDSLKADCIDQQTIKIEHYNYQANLLNLDLSAQLSQQIVSESLCSHLLKSNCLITNQPDWASIFIQYTGAAVCHASLLKYLVSFRSHNEFHEQCVERIFIDFMNVCKPKKLTVYARYTRRGGLDINPWRSNCLQNMDNIRLARQ